MHKSQIAEAFDRTCRDRREDAAVVWLPDATAIRFGDLWRQFEQIRRALQHHGVTGGDCVVSLVGNHPVFFPLLAACMEAGAVLLPLGEATDAEALAIVEKSRAAAVVTDRALTLDAADATAIDRGVSIAALRRDDDSGQGDHKGRPYGSSVVVKLTSGSTDLPKATLASEAAVLNDARSVIDGMSIGPNDINLAAIPLSHAYAIGNIVVPLIIQGTAAALRPAFSPGQFLEDARTSGATVFPGVPFMFDRLRDAVAEHGFPASLKLLITAGARIDPETVRWFHEHGRKIHSFYGASETGGITYDETDELPEPLHVGRPLPGVTIDLVPEPGVSDGGRVFVRSTALASGYAATSAAPADAGSPFQDGGFLTGDVGFMNRDGQLVLTGRVSPLINVAGRKVDPAEVERVLVALPEVAEARVVGVDCATRGQELVAFLLPPRPSLTPLALRRSCARTLSPYKIPRRFIFLERWPVDARGKVDKRALEALAGNAVENTEP
jgi:acyl-coenzyme A synthetase/AMP-(fatty) acid ligase